MAVMSIRLVKENPFLDLKNVTTSTIALDWISKIMWPYDSSMLKTHSRRVSLKLF